MEELSPNQLASQIEKANKAQVLIVRLFDEDPTRITDSLVFKFYFDFSSSWIS